MSNHDEQKSKNIIIYDWLSFTLLDNKYDPESVSLLLGLGDLKWENIKGMHGYQERWYYDGISIHHNGLNPGVWIEMSGQGCRCFETVSGISWDEVFAFIMDQSASHITRLDVAYDDHSGILDIDQMCKDIKDDLYVTSFRGSKIEKEYGKEFAGTSIYFGSPQSSIRLRIYDKAAERKRESEHWIRCEMQLRDQRAEAFISQIISGADIGDTFSGVMLNYLRFVDENPDDSNRYRWPTKEYWQKFIGDVKRLTLWSSPGVEYNLERLDHFVYDMAGRAIDTTIKIYGSDRFLEAIKKRVKVMSPKYKALLEHAQDLGISLSESS